MLCRGEFDALSAGRRQGGAILRAVVPSPDAAKIANMLRAYLAASGKLDPSTLTMDDPLLSGGLIDSFRLIDLALFVEQEFGVHLDDTELNVDHFDTLADLAALIHSRL
jgi:acyl carrier protein